MQREYNTLKSYFNISAETLLFLRTIPFILLISHYIKIFKLDLLVLFFDFEAHLSVSVPKLLAAATSTVYTDAP